MTFFNLNPDEVTKPYAIDTTPRQWDETPGKLRQMIEQDAIKWPLLLIGPPGCGKTCAGLAMLDHFKAGPALGGRLYRTASHAADEWRQAMMGRLESYTELELWDMWGRLGLSFVDEIGARDTVSDHEYRTLLRLLDTRQGKRAIYASNLDSGALNKVYDGRVLSRIASGTVFRFPNCDRRMKNA